MADEKDENKVVTLKPKKSDKEGAKILPFDPDMMPPRKVLQEAMDHVDQIESVMIIILRKDGGVGLECSDMDIPTLSVLVHRAEFEMMDEIHRSFIVEDDKPDPKK